MRMPRVGTSRTKQATRKPISGLDTSQDAEFIDERATPDCQNMELNRENIRKRIGTLVIGDDMGERVQAIRQLQIGSDIFVVRVGLSKVQVLDQNASSWSDIHHALLTGTVPDRIDFAFPLLSGEKIMVFTNGVDAIRKWTGTGNTDVLGGSPPLARFCIAYGSYLLLAYTVEGGDTFYTRVRWCDTNDPEDWTEASGSNAGHRDLLEDDQDITGVGLFGDYVTIHKDGAIFVGYLVSSSEVFRFDRRNTGVGAASFDTIRNIPTGDQIFLARDGIHLFNGITAPLIPSPVMDEMRETMNPEHIAKATAVVVRELDEYWVAVPVGSQTEPETVYKYNYRTGQVYKDLRTNLTCFGIYEKINKLSWDEKTNTWDADTTRWNDVIYLALNPTVMVGDTAGETSRREPIYNDKSSAIESFWTTKDYTAIDLTRNPLDEGRLVRWQDMEVWAKGNEVTVEYSTDRGATWVPIATSTGSSLGVFTLTSEYPTDADPLVGYYDVVSSQIRFRFKNYNASESWTMKKFYHYAVLQEERAA